MKITLLSVVILLVARIGYTQDCDCSSYPFKPNPPCYSLCVAKLANSPISETEKVRNIDPGVSLGIGVLSKSKDKTGIDFNAIHGKSQLEKEAIKSLKTREMQ